MKLKELAILTGSTISGDPEVEITGVSGIIDAAEGDITLLADNKNLGSISGSNASAFIVKEEIKDLKKSMLISDNPRFIFARALEILHVEPSQPSGVSDKAVIGENVVLGADISIHPLAYIGSNVSLGARVTISPGAYIGDNVSIDEDSIIYPNVTIREKVTIGKKVIIHSGTIIGSDGFGYVPDKSGHYKIPQIGGVIIGDRVEIGANVTIDRATTGNTIIGSGSKIDNLSHVAHNAKLGKNCMIIAQVGISGSVEIGDGAILAGQVGVSDHVKIGRNAKVGAKSGIAKDIPEGQVHSGIPAIPHGSWLRAQNIFSKLPEYIKRLQKLERKLEDK
ncbi:MAG TPA: UDP-3-O-(3-hydroxymyristoyl)glucosamine N-acyltransferase [Nitrospirae bacterium]|nr:UDP-3-O-(3-hydroxymyristoyl)glucosamine N-acyltransferase [Nitrospirota bacterium]HEW81548.1 UDP-3-O-(3-hydroxymyristoyl)glucosamine N-acyltransferase [Nitrospirota bacterium]